MHHFLFLAEKRIRVQTMPKEQEMHHFQQSKEFIRKCQKLRSDQDLCIPQHPLQKYPLNLDCFWKQILHLGQMTKYYHPTKLLSNTDISPVTVARLSATPKKQQAIFLQSNHYKCCVELPFSEINAETGGITLLL
ncbi:hypothetical protein ACJX0J_041295, partial [Zea mays]